jgi:hypothetical protein
MSDTSQEQVQSPRWLRIYATELESGDRINLAGEYYTIRRRTYTDVTALMFTVVMWDGLEMSISKGAKVLVFDPDGSVTKRVHEIPAWHS